MSGVFLFYFCDSCVLLDFFLSIGLILESAWFLRFLSSFNTKHFLCWGYWGFEKSFVEKICVDVSDVYYLWYTVQMKIIHITILKIPFLMLMLHLPFYPNDCKKNMSYICVTKRFINILIQYLLIRLEQTFHRFVRFIAIGFQCEWIHCK